MNEENVDAIGAAIDEKRRKWRDDYIKQAKKCVFCKYTGMILCSHNENGQIYAFKCNKCDAFERQTLAPSFPEWDAKNLIHEFTPLI